MSGMTELEAQLLQLQAYVDQMAAACRDPVTPDWRRQSLLLEMRSLQKLLLDVQREVG